METSKPAPRRDDERHLHDGNGALDQQLMETEAELRALAGSALREWRSVSPAQTTSLIHDAYVRLAQRGVRFQDRNHFLRTAAIAMRCILVDRARRAAALKRGGDRVAVSLTDDLATAPRGSRDPGDLLSIDRALDSLRGFDERKCRLVELRFFAGLTMEDAAEALGVSLATAKREWAVARAWLAREIEPRG